MPKPDRRRDAQLARRLRGRVGEQRLGRVQLVDDLGGRAVQHLALLGQHEPARVAMEQRDLQLSLQRRNLTAHRRLAHVQAIAGMREAARLGGRVKDPELIPVHSRTPHPRANRRRARNDPPRERTREAWLIEQLRLCCGAT